MFTAFISYSHKDKQYKDDLLEHLHMLKRDKLLFTWHDREIPAGGELDPAIATELAAADIILLLISASFIMSDYCFSVEMQQAMERHARGEAVVVPIIVRPCDWKTALFGKLKALPDDGVPIAEFHSPDKAYFEIATGLRNLVQQKLAPRTEREAPSGLSPESAPRTPVAAALSTSLPRKFSDLEKDEFLHESFAEIRQVFEASLVTLEREHQGYTTKLRTHGSDDFSAVIYRGGDRAASCRIWIASLGGFGSAQIHYSNSDSGSQSYNESLSVEVAPDRRILKLRSMMSGFGTNSKSEKSLDAARAAELLWNMLIQPLKY